MDEEEGTTAYDSQGTNNGTLVNGPTWQSSSNCVSGSCLSFDGSNDYVACGNDGNLVLSLVQYYKTPMIRGTVIVIVKSQKS